MTLSDIEEYILRSIAVLGGNMHSQITVENLIWSVYQFIKIRGKNVDSKQTGGSKHF